MAASRRFDESRRDVRGTVIILGGSKYLLLSFEGPGDTFQSKLTPAESSVVAAVLAGHSNNEIARQRGTSPRTIANQLASIFNKLGIRSRAQLAVRWAEAFSPKAP